MASIKLGSFVSDIRGKLGGIVFSRSRNGAYVRTYTKPTNTNTASQQEKRNNLATYAGIWRTLSDAERQSWIDTTPQFPYQNRVGESSQYSGFQLYMRINMILESAALDQ